MTVRRSILLMAVAVLTVAILHPGAAGVRAADEAPPASFVSLKLEGACDAQNTKLWLANTHTFKTIATTVRWRAAGGKILTDQFYPGPSSIREIGCAAEAEILEAKFSEF